MQADDGSVSIPFGFGERRVISIELRVSGRLANTYTITARRAVSSDATLSGLVLTQSDGTTVIDFDSGFVPGTTIYSTSVARDVTQVRVMPTATDVSSATITVNNAPVESGAMSGLIALGDAGDTTTITIVVTAADRTTTERYQIGVERLFNDDATLSDITLAGITPSGFAPGLTTYRISPVANDVEEIVVTAMLSDRNASFTITANGAQATADGRVALRVGDNTIEIRVIAENGMEMETYRVTVRRLNNDATLRGLVLTQSDGTAVDDFRPGFVSGTTTYTASVAHDVSQVIVTPTATDVAGATITVEDTPVVSGAMSGLIMLGDAGDEPTTIAIKVTAEDGEAMETYQISVTRRLNDDATLSNLVLTQSDGTAVDDFIPGFDATEDTYTASVAHDVEQVIVTTTATDVAGAMITVNDDPVESGEMSDLITLGNVGETTTITIVVTAADGKAMETYTIRVTRRFNDDATLSDITLEGITSEGITPPGFTPEMTTYRIPPVANDVEEIVVTPMLSDGNARFSIFANGVLVEDGIIALEVGDNTIEVRVIAEDDEETETYQVTVRRLNNDATLSGLVLTQSDGMAVDDFMPEFVSGTITYTASVAHDVSQVIVIPTATDVSSATITVNDVAVNSGAMSSVTLGDAGDKPTTIVIKVTAEDRDAMETYTIRVTRRLNDDATLSNLVLTQGDGTAVDDFMPEFASGTTTYTASVAHDVSQVIVMPTATDAAGAMITVNDDPVVSGAMSDLITLGEVGEATTIAIKVTAADGMAMENYQVIVTRERSRNTRLSILEVAPDGSVPGFDPASENQQTSYSVELDNDVANTTLTAMANDENATLTITERGGEPSDADRRVAVPVMLAEGESKDFTIVVTAQDTTVMATYIVTISRSGAELSNNANLSVLRILSNGTQLISFGNLATNINYMYNIANPVVGDKAESVRLVAETANSNARIIEFTVDGEPATLGDTISLGDGETKIARIRVRAQDMTTFKTYTVTITRQRSQDTRLSRLEVSPSRSLPGFSFDPATATQDASYSLELANDVANTTLTAVANNTSATLTITEGSDAPSAANRKVDVPVTLTEGESKDFTIVVTAQDTTVMATYTVTLSRAGAELSDNANLSVLRVVPNVGSATSFGNLATDINYMYNIANPVVGDKATSVMLEAETENSNARIIEFTVDGEPATLGDTILLGDGETKIARIRVRAQDMTTFKTYTVTITRQRSQDTRLSRLEVSPSRSLPGFSFDPATATQDASYSLELANNVANTTLTAVANNTSATLTITERSNPPSAANRRVAVPVMLTEGESKDFTIVVTAQDTTVMATYTVTLSRAGAELSDNANLSVLRVVPNVGSATSFGNLATDINYMYNIANPVVGDKAESVRLVAETANSNARIIEFTVDGEPATLGDTISLGDGETKIARIRVRAQDMTTFKTYTVTITRQRSQDTRLSRLEVSPSRSLPGFSFDPATATQDASYSLELTNDVANTTLTAVANNTSATLTITEGSDAPSAANRKVDVPVTLTEGESKDFTIVVTAQDTTVMATYTVTLSRAGAELSDNANLSVLRVVPNVGSATSFGNLATDINYMYNIANPVVGDKATSVMLEAETENSNARIIEFTVDGEPATLGDTILLGDGETKIARIRVRAQDMTTFKIYTVTITRQRSQDTRLSRLEVSPSRSLPGFSFDPATATQDASYSLELANNVANTTLTAVANNTSATLTITEGSDAPSAANRRVAVPVMLTEGESKDFTIVVTAQDTTVMATYTVTLSRAGAELSDNANLSVLRVVPNVGSATSFGNLATDINYMYNIANPVVGDKATSVMLEAAVVNSNAMITEFTVDGEPATLGDTILLGDGETKIARIRVRAQDMTTFKIYTVTITRQRSQDTRLSRLEVSPSRSLPGFSFDPATATQDASYSLELANNVANTTLTAVANNTSATLTITEGSDAPSAANRRVAVPVMLTEGESKDFTIVVTAQDTTVMATYTVTLSRRRAEVDTDTSIRIRVKVFLEGPLQ